MTKRLFDLLVSSTLLFVTLPLFPLIALSIKCTSKGPIFFRGIRIGKNGKLLTWWKFRTMRLGAKEELTPLLDKNVHMRKEWEAFQKIRYDPRVTPVGKFLRKFSIDELPQLWNVLKGDLSIVGPRPPEIYNKERALDEMKRRFKRETDLILSIKPGLTCLWQTQGRSKLTTIEQAKLDIFYAHNRTFVLDCKIVWKTIFTVLFPSGAY